MDSASVANAPAAEDLERELAVVDETLFSALAERLAQQAEQHMRNMDAALDRLENKLNQVLDNRLNS